MSSWKSKERWAGDMRMGEWWRIKKKEKLSVEAIGLVLVRSQTRDILAWSSAGGLK